MNEFYIIDAAAALYSGGWRKEDFEVLKKSAYFSVCIKPHGGGQKMKIFTNFAGMIYQTCSL